MNGSECLQLCLFFTADIPMVGLHYPSGLTAGLLPTSSPPSSTRNTSPHSPSLHLFPPPPSLLPHISSPLPACRPLPSPRCHSPTHCPCCCPWPSVLCGGVGWAQCGWSGNPLEQPIPSDGGAFPQHRPRCRVGGERVSLAGVELSAGDGHTAAAMSWATPSTRSRPAAVGCGEKGTSRRTPSPPAWRDPEATDGQPPQIPATRTALPQGRGGLIMVYKVRAVGGRRDH